MGKLILITGGARSGKSKFASKLAAESDNDVTFIATCIPSDDETKERIKRHREKRPPDWVTIEEGRDLGHIFDDLLSGTVIVDCLTLWITNLLLDGRSEDEIFRDVERTCQKMRESGATVIVVTNEVGMGIVPDNPLGRRFRDLAGLTNQIMAQWANEVYLVTAGIPLRIKGDQSHGEDQADHFKDQAHR